MPMYEYKCAKCGAVEELLVSYSEADRDDFACENCGGKLQRIFSVTADCRADGSARDGGAGGGKE